MLEFNNLNFYVLPTSPTGWVAPPWLKLQLGVFSGRLYFNIDEYTHVCESLNLVESDGGELTWRDLDEPGQDDRLSFVRDWLLLRRREQDFTHTPMGMLCQQQSLTAEFFGASRKNLLTGNDINKEHKTDEFKALFGRDDKETSIYSDDNDADGEMI